MVQIHPPQQILAQQVTDTVASLPGLRYYFRAVQYAASALLHPRQGTRPTRLTRVMRAGLRLALTPMVPKHARVAQLVRARDS